MPIGTPGGRFQFLIGTLKTPISKIFLLYLYLVSIPHRYAKNNSHLGGIGSHATFQFLIGTLKTRHLLHLPLHILLFQFLIGTLKTLYHAHHYSYNP